MLMGMLEAQRRLVGEVAGMSDRLRTLGLDQPRQVETLDVFHRQDEALAEPCGVVGRDDVGVAKPGRRADLAEEAVDHTGEVDEVASDDLEDLQSAHEPILGQVDHAHPAAPQLADDLIVGVVGQARGDRMSRRRSGPGHAPVDHREAVDGGDRGIPRAGPDPGVAEPAEEAVGRRLGDAAAAVRALLKMQPYGSGRGVIEPAEAVGVQDLVGRMEGLRRAHGTGLRVESGPRRTRSPPMDYERSIHEEERSFRRCSPQSHRDHREDSLDATQTVAADLLCFNGFWSSLYY